MEWQRYARRFEVSRTANVRELSAIAYVVLILSFQALKNTLLNTYSGL